MVRAGDGVHRLCRLHWPNPGNERVFVATGDSGQGITHGALAAFDFRLILKVSSPWQELYEPSRKTAAAIGDYLAENATAIKSFAEYVAPGEIDLSTSWHREKAPLCGKASTKSQPFATRRARSTSVRRHARTWVVRCTGIPSRLLGLPLPWLAFCRRRHSLERAGGIAPGQDLALAVELLVVRQGQGVPRSARFRGHAQQARS